MKREDVKGKITGITDEQLNWIMNENGADINAEKNKAVTLQGKIDTMTEQLKTAQDGLKAFEGVDVAELKGKIEKLQNDLNAQSDAFSFDSALDGAIRDMRGKNVKAVRSLLDVDALKQSKDRTSDMKAAIEKCLAENAWAFDAAQDKPDADSADASVKVNTAAEHGSGGSVAPTLESEISAALFSKSNP